MTCPFLDHLRIPPNWCRMQPESGYWSLLSIDVRMAHHWSPRGNPLNDKDKSFHLPTTIYNFGHVDDIIPSLSAHPCPLLSTTLLAGTSLPQNFEFRISRGSTRSIFATSCPSSAPSGMCKADNWSITKYATTSFQILFV